MSTKENHGKKSNSLGRKLHFLNKNKKNENENENKNRKRFMHVAIFSRENLPVTSNKNKNIEFK